MEVGSLHKQIGILCSSTRKLRLSFIVLADSISVNNKFFSLALKYYICLFVLQGTLLVAQLTEALRYKLVTGSIPDDVIGNFH
jgi:hypothetical protein